MKTDPGPQAQFVFHDLDTGEVARFYKFDGRDRYTVYDADGNWLDSLSLANYEYQALMLGPDKRSYPAAYAEEKVYEHNRAGTYWHQTHMRPRTITQDQLDKARLKQERLNESLQKMEQEEMEQEARELLRPELKNERGRETYANPSDYEEKALLRAAKNTRNAYILGELVDASKDVWEIAIYNDVITEHTLRYIYQNSHSLRGAVRRRLWNLYQAHPEDDYSELRKRED
jgi:hypothetical protein